MDTKTRVALLSAAGFGAAGALYYFYFRNKQESSLVRHFVVPGTIFAVGLNTVGFLHGNTETQAVAKANGEMGSLPKEAIDLLSNLNADTLYANLKKAGLKIAEIPENPSVILQDEV